MKIFLTFLLLSSQMAVADKLPDNSSILWKDVASYFRSLDYSDESKFKENLKAHHAKIYGGDLYNTMVAWIEKGTIESEYYSDVYCDRQDSTIKSIKRAGKNTFKVKAVQNSRYHIR